MCCVLAVFGVTIISMEVITKKAIEAYQYEWKELQSEQGSPTCNQDNMDEIIPDENQFITRGSDTLTPPSTVKPTISVDMFKSPLDEDKQEEFNVHLMDEVDNDLIHLIYL